MKNFKLDPIRNALIRKIIDFDFESLVENKDNHIKLKTKSKMLISATFLLKQINEIEMYAIPKNILETARNHGKSVMEMLKLVVENRISDLNDIWGELDTKETVKTIIDWLIDRDCKILAIEKFITDSVYCGYVDMLVREKNGAIVIYEIKCRNNPNMTMKDCIQMEMYSRMLHNLPCRLLVIDRNNIITTTDYQQMRSHPMKEKIKSFVLGYTPLLILLKVLNTISENNFPIPEKIEIGMNNE